ncbi:VWA domain-containing protein [archaeon]|nr:VWA domain-containing protein [archaeon]
MVSLGPFNLQTLWGLYALLSLVPLILLYLIKPKPKLLEVPSLMFFLKSMGANKITSFFKQFTKDWLFLIQILALLLITLILLTPFIEYFHDISAAHTVLVLDVSASMQTKEGSTTRFDKMIQKAKEVLGSRNTVVLAKYYNKADFKDQSKSETIDYLNTLRPVDTSTRLGDAIIAAGSILEQTSKNKEGRIIVISDFINTEGQDPLTAKSILESKGLIVDFINVASTDKKDNVGFVKLIVDDQSSVAYIKNFNDYQKTVQLKVGDVNKELVLGPEQAEPFSFQTVGGVTKLEITPKDDLDVDNVAYLSAPQELKAKALIITNNESIFLTNGLKSTKLLDVEVTNPPIIPSGDYDLYVLYNINPNEILTGTFEDLKTKVENGANLIVHVQEDMDKVDFKGLINLPLIEKVRSGEDLIVQQINKFTKNVDFGKVEYFWMMGGGSTLSPFVTALNTTIIGMESKGKGKILYYGILEKSSDFKFSPSYPIFWTEVVKFLLEKQDISQLNHPTKDFLTFLKPQEVKNPSGKKIITQTLVLEEAGLYQLPEQYVAANLLDERESSLTATKSFAEKNSEEYSVKAVKEKQEFDLSPLIIFLLMLTLAGETFYIKTRGML